VHGNHDPEFRGEFYWPFDDLSSCEELGLGAKLHATDDASVRLAFDRLQWGHGE